MITVAALFVDPRGCYSNVEGVELWDEARDARKYDGPHPVVAHPPCARWCQLAPLVEARHAHLRGRYRGKDDGCFAAALASVRRWGGVLEHPAYTTAWLAHDLCPPVGSGWQRLIDGGWVCQVAQSRYGHRLRKTTWLYARGIDPARLRWGRGESATWMTWLRYDGRGRPMRAPGGKRMGKRERNATPPEFRDALIEIARSARRQAA